MDMVGKDSKTKKFNQINILYCIVFNCIFLVLDTIAHFKLECYKKYKFKRKSNSLYLSLRYSIGCSIRTILINILIIPLYFFVPIGNLLIFIFING